MHMEGEYTSHESFLKKWHNSKLEQFQNNLATIFFFFFLTKQAHPDTFSHPSEAPGEGNVDLAFCKMARQTQPSPPSPVGPWTRSSDRWWFPNWMLPSVSIFNFFCSCFIFLLPLYPPREFSERLRVLIQVRLRGFKSWIYSFPAGAFGQVT